MSESRLERTKSRVRATDNEIRDWSERVDAVAILAVIEYLEKRFDVMRGDESVKAELEQIRLDLAALVTMKFGG